MSMRAHPSYEVATVLQHQQHVISDFISNRWKQRALFAIARCRTHLMGGHIDKCNHAACGKLHLSYNSCRNRHCPKCQGHLRERWIEAREAEVLKCAYFHVVFTLPVQVNPLAIAQPKTVYNALFKSAWATINDFGKNTKFLGAQAGMIAVLHTWGQNLSLHPHLHCIVPAGGITKQGKWRHSKNKGKFLFPVKVMSKVFRARFMAQISKQMTLSAQLRQEVFAKPWVVYAKQPFYGPKQVIEYLGRYTHKIAISNHRIQHIKDGQVYFAAKDYRKGGKKVNLMLQEQEFIRRFALHILPKGFTRIRHYGILSSSTKKRLKESIDAQLGAVFHLKTKPLCMHRICPVCKKGLLETILTFDQRGPPKHWLNQLNQ